MTAEGNVLTSLGINPVILIGQVINFCVLMFILHKFLYKPILKKLDERSKLVKDGLKAAEENLKRQQEIEALKEKELAKARTEAEEFIAKAKDSAQSIKTEIVDQAKTEAQKIALKQEAEINEKLAKQEKELQQKMVDIAAVMAKQVLSQFIDKKTQDVIVDEQLKKLASKEQKS